MTKYEQFNLAVELVLKYDAEGVGDEAVPHIFGVIAQVCPDAYDRILVMAQAAQTKEFEEYGLSNPKEILRNFEITRDLEEDVARFLDLMRQEDEKIMAQARAQAKLEAELAQDNPVREQAIAFFNRFGTKATRRDLEQFLAEQ